MAASTRRHSRSRGNSRRKRIPVHGGVKGGKKSSPSCEELFAMKRGKKWKDLPDIKLSNRLKYSVCKRRYATLKKKYSSQPISEVQQYPVRNTMGVHGKKGNKYIIPSMPGKLFTKSIQASDPVVEASHRWLDENGWTDSNLAKAARMQKSGKIAPLGVRNVVSKVMPTG